MKHKSWYFLFLSRINKANSFIKRPIASYKYSQSDHFIHPKMLPQVGSGQMCDPPLQPITDEESCLSLRDFSFLITISSF